jgi:hypothetical protein
MKYKENANRIIELIKGNDGIETKHICAILDLTVNQFVCAQPLVESHCYRFKKKWRMTIVEKERHLANREVINAKAREKTRLKREAKLVTEALETPCIHQISTQWIGKNPFLSMMQ